MAESFTREQFIEFKVSKLGSLLGYLKDLFGRRPELMAEEAAIMRIDFGLRAEAGTEAESQSQSESKTVAETKPPAEPEAEDESGGRMMIPFGPFLALGALEFLFFGERIIDAYFALFAG